jgi:hypothetical protein
MYLHHITVFCFVKGGVVPPKPLNMWMKIRQNLTSKGFVMTHHHS